MYSAIVFLPLLGAIIAGIVSVYGAWQRTSGAAEEPSQRGHHASHSHAHDAEDEHEHGGGHDEHEPAAASSLR